MITSKDNSKIKFARSLKQGKNRRKYGKFIIEGFKIVEEAIKSRVKIDSLFYCPKALESSPENINLLEGLKKNRITETYFISDSLMNSISDTVTSQGIIAIIDDIVPLFEDREDNFTGSIWLLACEIQDPGNLGTIIRTADAAGASGILLSPGTADPTSPKVIRATMGSIFHIKLLRLKDVKSFILSTGKKGVTFASAHIAKGKFYNKVDYKFPLVLIAGNESRGLPSDITALSDIIINIPIYGSAESLNVAVASGIILYEIAAGLQKRHER